MTPAANQQWTAVVTQKKPLFDVPFREIWKYRDLIYQFVRRDLVTQHKQTVLGPVWFFVQPIISSVVMTVVFGKIANLPTNETPKFLFYLSGVTIWYYFSAVLSKTSNTFSGNAHLFTKIYFPRLSVPIAQSFVAMWHFCIQFLIFLGFYLYFLIAGYPIEASYRVVIIPFLILQAGLLGMGCGCLISAFTTRFKDLQMAVAPGIQLWMYASCIFFPRSMVPPGYQWVMLLNPVVSIVEAFRFAMMGKGEVEIWQWLVSVGITLVIFFLGIIEFGRAEKNFADTI
ncbi:MAG: ABC transporter permease [Terrimicrobiaceae bacterium]